MMLDFLVLSRGIPDLVRHQEKYRRGGNLKCRFRILILLNLNHSSGFVGLEKKPRNKQTNNPPTPHPKTYLLS